MVRYLSKKQRCLTLTSSISYKLNQYCDGEYNKFKSQT